MNVFSRTLVAVDGSEAATAALHFAMRCVQAVPGAELRIISLFDRNKLIDQCTANPYVFSDLAAVLEAAEQACRETVRDAFADARGANLKASGDTVTGPVIAGIIEEARRWDASCIAMGTHGRHGVARVFFGSVAEGVLRDSPCPVLTTHAEDGAEYPLPMRILCAVDNSPAARRAFDLAVQLAPDLHCHLDLVSINQACSHLEAFAEEARERGLDVTVHIRDGADTGAALVVCATILHSGLVILGTHGRSGFERAVYGSTAEHVIRASAAPVLAVRDPSDVSKGNELEKASYAR